MTASEKKRSLFVIAIVSVVNALGYGIIIPIQYSYVAHFGVNAFWLGVLFASFSLAQFISTPIIGRLSDRYGRKPLLFFSVFGTMVSFLLFALANSMPMLFLARILDGISGGNISVAQAVISDVTEVKERGKWFGILGASFGFGFVVGPAVGGLLSGYSLQMPFYFAAAISLIACVIIAFIQKESLTKELTEKKELTSLFDPRSLVHALSEPFVGVVLVANFIAVFAFSLFMIGFQAFTNEVLALSPKDISLLFIIFGVIGLIMQGFATGKLIKIFGEVKLLLFGVVLSLIAFIGMGVSHTYTIFLIASVLLAIGNSFLGPMLTTLLSKHTKKEDQGGIMGISQSYASLANIIGPIIGGILATRDVSFAFLAAATILFLMLLQVLYITRIHGRHVVDL